MLRPIYNQLSRLAYFYKINKAYVDLSERVPLSDVNVIHAHTWFTDGGLAYKIYKRHSIPYVITVRSTDLSAFARYFYHTHRYARNVLLNAKRIIFLSETYKNQVLQLPFIKKYASSIEGKSLVLPNGIDSFWINNTRCRKTNLNQKVKLIYIGS